MKKESSRFFLQILNVNISGVISRLEVTEAIVRRCSLKKGVLKGVTICTGKHLRWSLFLNEVGSLRCNFAKFLRTPFL